MAVTFALRSTYHTTLQAMPVNVKHLADWTAIKARKQLIIHKNNRIENLK